MTVTQLPRPATAARPDPARPEAARPAPRWLPSRAGIVNVWRYYDEIFTFHEGRLLLRGPNGSGKSKALELLLPFLFDANLRASRLSTFGTGERTMHWNLMGEGTAGTTRVGYVWLEFRHGDDPGRWYCCGARLQASTHTTTVHADYFTTHLRIGTPDGLALVNEAGQPLTRGALEESLGDRGTLHDNAGEYKAAVRAELFPGLTEQRYDALITALLQLRTPKLSQRLDPALLSTLLSRALPPLGQQEISDLAEGFERLDRQRERLKTQDEEVAAARRLAARQRTYAQRVLRAGAATLISATTDLDNLTRTARRSAEEYESVAVRKAEAQARTETLQDAIATLGAQVTGITESEAYQQGRNLDRLRQDTVKAERRASDIRADADRKRAATDADASSLASARHRAAQREESVRVLADETRHAAVRASLASVHDEIAAGLGDDGHPRSLLRAAVRSRHGQLTTVRGALDQHDRAVDRRKQAEADLEAARNTLAQAHGRQEAAGRRHQHALTELTSRLADWAVACRELCFPDPGALLDAADSEPAVLRVIEAAAGDVLDGIAGDTAVTQAQRESAQAERDRLAGRLDGLSRRRDLPPEPPPTRTADRNAMAGAPFWRLVDFAGHVPEDVKGRIEAAVQAAGLLDAWVGPAGSVDGHDIFADPAALEPAAGRSLADVLVPEPDGAGGQVPAQVVRSLLAAIAFGEDLPDGHPAAVGADGSWRMGSLHGSWRKDEAAYIGLRARQRAREQLMRQLASEIAAQDELIAELGIRLAGLDARRTVVANERAARPDHRELTEAAQALVQADADVTATDTVVRQRVEAVSVQEKKVATALRSLTGLAAEHGVPAERAALDALATALERFQHQAESWLDEHGQLVSAQLALRSLAGQAARAAEAAADREREAADAATEYQQLATMLAAVEGSVGVDYRELLARLDALRGQRSGRERELTAARRAVPDLAQQLGTLDERRKSDAEAGQRATSARDAAARRFRHLASGVFAADSGIGDLARFQATLAASDGVRAALDAARLAAAAWPSITYAPNNLLDAQHLLSESVHTCRETLSAQADLDLDSDEDVQVFTAVVNGVRVGAAELLDVLRSEAERSRHEITEQERELFDQTLTGDTRRHLADRIRQANELVDQMNARLERVRTASKVAVRLVWQVAPDLPPGTKAARDLLLKDPVRLTEADRESLHRFFRERIEQAKAQDTAASWEQQLAQVFDYTAWHQFVVRVDRANGTGWQLLTRKLHGALSGGEKAIALHLPLFAAVAAHYQAVPEAPRVILLDEVFVGVDTSNRGQVFALLSALDLDLVLTSDHEWCTYAELSGISIHQLITGSDDDAVTTARFTWDGHALIGEEGDGG
jgi:uncharacterized protein (TIGR02680 family)